MAAATGETVTFAPGTFSSDTRVTLSVYDASEVPAPPAGFALVGHAIDLQPTGVTFNPPAVVTFPYTDAELTGADTSSLSIWVYLNGAWQQLGGTIDPVHHTVSLSVPHFTLYALMVRRSGPSHGLPGTGGGGAGESGGRELLASLAALAGAVGALSLAAGMGRRGETRNRRFGG